MNRKTSRSFTVIAVAMLSGLALGMAGCSTPATSARPGPSTAAAQKKPAVGQSGALLWAQTCGHCHNIRSPDFYGHAQWEVAMLHMRVRANLTAEEYTQILAFMKTAH